MKKQNKKKKGFTLIELIIVLAVMAIIGAIAIPNFAAVRDNSKVKADRQSCKTIQRTVLMLLADGTITVNKTPASTADVYSVAYSGTPALATVTASATGNAGYKDELEEALKDTKKPQTDTTFSISIDDKENVTVTTGSVSSTD